MLAKDENFTGLERVNRELIGRTEALDSQYRVVLDMDSTETPVYGGQEHSAYTGHFESSCFHPLLLFKRGGDCLAAKLRLGKVHSADGFGKAGSELMDLWERKWYSVGSKWVYIFIQ